MPLYRVPLAEPVPQTRADELSRRVCLVSELITDFTIVAADGQVSEVLLTTSVPVGREDLARGLAAVIARDILPRREVPTPAVEA